MRQGSFMDCIHNVIENMMEKLPDWVTGSSEIMKYKYKKKYGDRECSLIIKRNKARCMALYLLIFLFFMAGVLYSIAGQWNEKEEITGFRRPDTGTASISIPVEAKIKYRNMTFKKDMTLKVIQKKRSEKEKLVLLNSFQDRLANLMLGENKDFEHICKPLNLMAYDKDTGITIDWTSSDPDRISEDGYVDVIGYENGEIVELVANIALDELTVARVYHLKIAAEPEKDDVKNSLLGRLKKNLNQNSEDSNPVMKLPQELSDGIEIRWFVRRDSHLAFLTVLCLIAVLIVYFKRYEKIDKEIKEAEESLIRDLPGFINKLVMLLNAGLVVSTAFTKIVSDYESSNSLHKKVNQTDRRFLYEELSEIHKRMDQSNTSLIKELTNFSKRSGVREMVRLTAVITDNWNKGSLLAEKLEGESGLLWLSRKKRAEERGRLAETKLTLPLVILLAVLIMVTIAPALMEM